MSLLLYINGELLDLEPGQVIAQTRQVNDLNSLENRQASYTNKFKVPKTANNVRIMKFMAVTGNNSLVPYQKNECSLYSDSGECFVYKGWAVVTDSGDSYDVVVYDGIIDLFKAVGSATLSELLPVEMNHTKNPEAIVLSWLLNLPYRYIAADYNGKRLPNLFFNQSINADYMVPSINVRCLWDSIFTKYNFSYSGSVFDHEDFTNLWLTFPKVFSMADNEVKVFEASAYEFNNNPIGLSIEGYYAESFTAEELDPQVIHTAESYKHIKVLQPGYYRIEVEGNIDTNYNFKLLLGKNCQGYPKPWKAPVHKTFSENQQEGEDFTHTRTVQLSAEDTICIMLRERIADRSFRFDGDCSLTVRIFKLNAKIAFDEAFSDFTIAEFLKEIVQRFGLTLYKDKYRDHYEFLTLHEQMQLSNTVNWSKKFSKKISENYIYGNYAQRNWFRYSYNDKESNYNDGVIDVPNINLPETRDVIKSKIYTPEQNMVNYLGHAANVYKLWEKEVEENPEEGEIVTYKALDKRFYLLRAVLRQSPVLVISPGLQESINSSYYYGESFRNLSFTDIVQEYYYPLRQVLDKSLIVNVELFLKETDIVNFDFRKLYYFEQLGAYFIMNKINSYVPGKPVKCELVRVLFDPVVEQPAAIKITKIIVQNHDVRIYYELNINDAALTLQVSENNRRSWNNLSLPGTTSPRYYNSTATGNFYVRLKVADYYSDSYQITIPSNTTIIPD